MTMMAAGRRALSGLAVAGVLCAGVLVASADNKKPAAPAPKAAPAKPAAPAKAAGGAPAGHAGGAGASGAGHTGPTTTSHGPTANGSGATTTHSGPTTANPHGTTTTTTAGKTPTATAGGKTPTAANNVKTPAGGRAGETGAKPHDSAPKTATGHVAPKGASTVATKNGAVTKRPDGKVSDVHDAKRGMDVHHGLNGSKKVVVERPDHSRVVAERGRPGYVQRRYDYHGHTYESRAYYYHGAQYNYYYRGYYYGGSYVNVYAPAYYYSPAYYGWAYNPWAAPISYGWGWGGSPWYGYYGSYFTPYPVYSAPALWLTDYMIAAELSAAYAAQQEAHTEAVVAANAAVAQAVMTAEVKAQIADEVKAQIALENAEAQQTAAGQEPDPASSGITRMFQDGKPHVFVAGGSLDVVDSSGAECALSDGDALQLASAPPADAANVDLVVLSSKGGKECAKAATVTVAVTDVQEMQNHMRQTIDLGLKELQDKQGKGGLPAAPASAKAPVTPSAIAKAAPPPDKSDAAEVNQQLAEADKVEAEAVPTGSPIGGVDSAAVTAAAPAAPVNIALGQTVDQVTAALGNPLTVVDLGTKKIYKYKDMKVTFKAGKVSDVE